MLGMRWAKAGTWGISVAKSPGKFLGTATPLQIPALPQMQMGCLELVETGQGWGPQQSLPPSSAGSVMCGSLTGPGPSQQAASQGSGSGWAVMSLRLPVHLSDQGHRCYLHVAPHLKGRHGIASCADPDPPKRLISTAVWAFLV